MIQPMPAPRYSDAVLDPPGVASDDTEALVAELGLDAADLRGRGVID